MMYHPKENRYKGMKYRRCGNSGLLLPAISLGLWHNFGDFDDKNIYKKVLFEAFDSGITHFDFANNYGPPPGSAEKNFGKILKKNFRGYRDEMVISTKAGYQMWPGPYGEWGSKKYLLSSLDKSLKRLGVDYIDIFYSHRFDPVTPLEETMEALCSACRSGKTLYVGISNYGPDETLEACNILKTKNVPLLVHQPKYSLLFREPENGLLDLLKEKKVGCISYSPLAQGLLTSKYLDTIPKESRMANPNGYLQEKDLTPSIIKKLKMLHSIADQRGQSLAQMSVSWLLNKEEITSVLIGARNVRQIKELIGAQENMEFSKSELNSIDEICNRM
jgi:L-glyceraldehyde 3-phosphate reductase